jgi:hypothetical protein
VVAFLKDEIGIGADGRFHGSVANITGVPGGTLMAARGVPEATPFGKAQINFREQYLRTFDSHLFLSGLWDLGIPSLEDNSHLVTPPFHFLVSRALSRPQDFHSRNWEMITKATPALMAALGARFLLSDREEHDPLLTERDRQTNDANLTIRVYEIARPNLGDLSPVRTVVSQNASETVSMLMAPDFPFADEAIVDGENLTGLTHADYGTLNYENGGFIVQAKSHGRSLLVVPVQFSHSLRIVSTLSDSSKSPIRLLRVNLVETGILFDHDIHIKIAHVFGLFRGINGRLEDIDDCQRLGIRETGEIPYPPDYQPLAIRHG